MNTTIVAAILFVCLVGVALLGRWVGRYLPADHLNADSKDTVKLAMGFVATMTAVLLGLLINSAKGTYDTARREVIQMAAQVAFLDRVLTLYGPQAAGARAELHDNVADAVRRMWPSDGGGPGRLDPNEEKGDAFYVTIHRLSPQNDIQNALKMQATTLVSELGQHRSLLQAQSIPSISKPLLMALVCWLVIIFFGFSIIGPPNATTSLALIASAFAVSCAAFLILELDHPFSGPIRVPSEPITNVLNHLVN